MKTLDWIVLGALAAAGVYLYTKRAAITSAINPLDPNNLAYSGVNAVGAAVSGDSNFNLGGSIFDLFNPGTDAAVAALSAPIQPGNTSDAGGASGGW